ncbi:hypothetical protein BJ742DRAFT_817701, partial [Cladochytrium replicatum]
MMQSPSNPPSAHPTSMIGGPSTIPVTAGGPSARSRSRNREDGIRKKEADSIQTLEEEIRSQVAEILMAMEKDATMQNYSESDQNVQPIDLPDEKEDSGANEEPYEELGPQEELYETLGPQQTLNNDDSLYDDVTNRSIGTPKLSAMRRASTVSLANRSANSSVLEKSIFVANDPLNPFWVSGPVDYSFSMSRDVSLASAAQAAEHGLNGAERIRASKSDISEHQKDHGPKRRKIKVENEGSVNEIENERQKAHGVKRSKINNAEGEGAHTRVVGRKKKGTAKARERRKKQKRSLGYYQIAWAILRALTIVATFTFFTILAWFTFWNRTAQVPPLKVAERKGQTIEWRADPNVVMVVTTIKGSGEATPVVGIVQDRPIAGNRKENRDLRLGATQLNSNEKTTRFHVHERVAKYDDAEDGFLVSDRDGDKVLRSKKTPGIHRHFAWSKKEPSKTNTGRDNPHSVSERAFLTSAIVLILGLVSAVARWVHVRYVEYPRRARDIADEVLRILRMNEEREVPVWQLKDQFLPPHDDLWAKGNRTRVWRLVREELVSKLEAVEEMEIAMDEEVDGRDHEGRDLVWKIKHLDDEKDEGKGSVDEAEDSDDNHDSEREVGSDGEVNDDGRDENGDEFRDQGYLESGMDVKEERDGAAVDLRPIKRIREDDEVPEWEEVSNIRNVSGRKSIPVIDLTEG